MGAHTSRGPWERLCGQLRWLWLRYCPLWLLRRLIPPRPPRDLALNPLSEEEVEAANCIRRLLRQHRN